MGQGLLLYKHELKREPLEAITDIPVQLIRNALDDDPDD